MSSLEIPKVHPTALPDWNNLEVLHRNTLPPRSYFHVYNSEEDALTYDTTRSRTHFLSGTWKFQHAYSPFEGPEGFEFPSFDTSSWSDIAVPGMWQLQGFGKGPQYTNVKFPIPVDPPNIPFTENETGSYVRKFTVPEILKGNQIRLRFEGVDSSFHVWVNGKEVGYSQGSRNPDEFDITTLINEDEENTLAVRVYQFCDGTYIEDQDQWWLSGIFRDVFLVGFPLAARIEDLNVKTEFDEKYENAHMKIKIQGSEQGQVCIRLLNSDKQIVHDVCHQISGTGTPEVFTINVEKPLKWTAETPNLYHLVVSMNSDQYISHRVGFRQVEMKDGLIKVNDQRIVFRGVNRHEHHPKFGRAVPLDFVKRDLVTMKRHNINAIRTSHQLNDPRLYDLADEMGFWVMDEADLECHGFESIEDAALSPEERALPFRERKLLTRGKAAKWTTDNPDWTHAYVDRAEHLVKRDQLHPSIIVWSCGNEAFYGRNFKAMYDRIRELDDSRPIHYEADIHAETMDMFSRMYLPVDELIEFGEDTTKKKPLVLCEFVHAMGNGPGNIKEYIEAFYKYPTLQGGFAWEWANHGLLTKDKETGEEYYGYGGDFGEVLHDSTFVMDGLVDSQHNPTPGLTEYKKAIEPVEFVGVSQGKAKFINRYDFITLDHLSCHLAADCTSQYPSDLGPFEIPSNIGPGQTFEIELPDPRAMYDRFLGEILLTVTFSLKNATPWSEAGFEIATAQIELNASDYILKGVRFAPFEVGVVATSRNTIEIKRATNTWAFNTLHGTLTSWTMNGMELIAKAPALSFFRAPTDNDIPQDGRDWKDKFLHLAKVSTRRVGYDVTDTETRITVHQRVAPPALSWSIECVLVYRFNAEGVTIHVTGVPKGATLPRTLPRIGMVMELPHEWQKLQWFGRGPGESYRDSKMSQIIRNHRVHNIDELWIDYEVPQESSNRTDTRWLLLENGQAQLWVYFADAEGKKRRTFDWQASHYRMEDVADATHPHKLRKKKQDNVILRLDAEHHGLGSGSCGPSTLDEYSLLTKEFEFTVLLEPRPGD